MSLASSAVTYTSVYTDSEPGRVFWGAKEELSDRGSSRVIVQPPVVSPTAELPGYVAKSNPEEDQEEYKDDETEDGLVDYPMDGGDDEDDDDGDSSRDEANDEDEDEEEEEHLAPSDSAVVIPTDELVSPPEGTEPVMPPPSTDTATTEARITAEVERLLAMPTPSPSPLASLSPPSAGERLARCTDPIALPSPTLSPPLHMPSHVDRRDDILETEMPPRKRLYLSTLGSRYEVRESSTARPTEGQGIDYGFVSTLDTKASGTYGRDSLSDGRHEKRDGRHAGQVVSTARRHVAASYWTAASDVAATSAPATVGHRWSTPSATGQRRRITVVIGGQRWRSTPPTTGQRWWSTTVNAADHRSTVAVNDGCRWRTTVDCRWTTVDHHRTTVQRWLVGRSTSGPGPVWIGSGPGPGRVWIGSATWHATCQPRVPTWQMTWIISIHGSRTQYLVVGVLAKTKRTTALGSGLNYITPYLLCNPYLN
nr:hypothetical protein [Tanacetum cinerariifolium]